MGVVYFAGMGIALPILGHDLLGHGAVGKQAQGG